MSYSDYQTPNSLAMIKCMVLVWLPRSRLFLSQTVSVWTSNMQQAVGLQLKGILVLQIGRIHCSLE